MTEEKIRVALDAGHGGDDLGCHRPWFLLNEKDYNLCMCRQVHNMIIESGLPYEPILLRVADENMNHRERARKAIDTGCSLVLHYHVNAHKDRSDFHGGMMFTWPGNARTASMADVMCRSWPNPLWVKHRWAYEATDDPMPDDDWLQRPRTVMQHYPMDTVLFECGYMSNKADAEALQQPYVKDGIVLATLCALVDYWRILS